MTNEAKYYNLPDKVRTRTWKAYDELGYAMRFAVKNSNDLLSLRLDNLRENAMKGETIGSLNIKALNNQISATAKYNDLLDRLGPELREAWFDKDLEKVAEVTVQVIDKAILLCDTDLYEIARESLLKFNTALSQLEEVEG